MKRFIYCESEEGGMDTHFVPSASDLPLYGWMSTQCAEEDAALVEWARTAEVGDYLEHRLGVMIRLKDVP